MTDHSKPEILARARVLLVDDHPIFLEGLAELIQRQPNLTCCGQCRSARDVLSAVMQLKPDLLLLDLRLKDGDALDLLPQLNELHPGLPVLVISQADQELYAERVLRAGARGYIAKEEATEEVLNAIATVLAGKVYVNPKVADRLMLNFIQGGAHSIPGTLDCLGNRELQVYRLLGEGYATRRIAQHLGLSIKTVQTYRENIKRKLGLPDAAALMRHAATWAGREGGS